MRAEQPFFAGMNDPRSQAQQQTQTRAPDGVDLGRPMPWPAGTRFDIDGPADKNGDGELLERGRTRVRLRLRLEKMPADKDPGPEQPRDGNVDVTYDLELQPNGRLRVRVTNNDDGTTLTDDPDASITQDGDHIAVEFKSADGKPHTLEMEPDGADQVETSLDGNGFNLNRR